jgi:methenyltetrahydrofolate cyclohydrolase
VGRLIESSVTAFADEMASGSPAPGGGSAAAFAGSMAASLVAMVCRLSIGKTGVDAGEGELTTALAAAETLRLRLLELVDEDTAAFEAVMFAVRMPKGDEAQRAARAAAMAYATFGAAEVPLETLTAAAQVLALAGPLVGRSNPAAASDLGAAVELARAAAEGAVLNVAINLDSLPPGDDYDRLRRETDRQIDLARTTSTAAVAATRLILGLA